MLKENHQHIWPSNMIWAIFISMKHWCYVTKSSQVWVRSYDCFSSFNQAAFKILLIIGFYCKLELTVSVWRTYKSNDIVKRHPTAFHWYSVFLNLAEAQHILCVCLFWLTQFSSWTMMWIICVSYPGAGLKMRARGTSSANTHLSMVTSRSSGKENTQPMIIRNTSKNGDNRTDTSQPRQTVNHSANRKNKALP